MVTGTLTPQMESAGRALTAALDQAGVDVLAALWLFMPEQNGWKFVIATPEVKSSGPKRVYQRVQTVVGRHKQRVSGIDLADVAVVPPDHELISLLRSAVRTDESDGIRFSQNTVNGHFIEDAFIYRIR